MTDAPQPAPPRRARLAPMAFGGDYNAEQWSDEVQLQDLDLMAEAGVTAVTVGVFSWALLEPEEGRYDFAWLDTIMDRLHGAGIGAVLATPSASPPTWFSATYPETLPVTDEGVRLGYGARESFCPSSPRFRAASAAMAGALAERYADHPALVLWHLGNEYGSHVGTCHCETSAEAFRTWLRARHGTIEALNEAWGTSFWGQVYSDFAHVTTPRRAPMPVNPAQQLDFRRFSSEEFLACYLGERDAVRRFSTDVPITTNLMVNNCENLDYWSWSRHLEVLSNNHYLVADSPAPEIGLAQSADLSRGLAGDRPWLLMEHSTSAVNWQPRNVAKTPGQMARNTLSHVARGADATLFFQWRASRFGGEKFHSAMVPHSGTTTRLWREVCDLGTAVARVAEVAGSQVVGDVGVVWDYEGQWALGLEYHPSVDVTFRDAQDRWFEALWREHRTVRYLAPGPVPAEVPVVMVPNLYLTTSETAKSLHEYVNDGGTLLVGFFSGIVDEHDAVHEGPLGAVLADTLGMTIDEFHPLLADQRVRLAGVEGLVDADTADTAWADVWSEELVLQGAEAVWTFADGPDAGRPALTRHRVGRGTAWYLATRPSAPLLRRLVAEVCAGAGLPSTSGLPDGLEVVRRVGDDADYLFAINHTDQRLALDHEGLDLLTGDHHRRDDGVPAGAVVVLKRPRPEGRSAR